MVRFEDFQIRIGDTDIVAGAGEIESNTICQTMPRDLYCQHRYYDFFCNVPLTGRYVTVQKIDPSNSDQPANANIWHIYEMRVFI